MWQTQDLPQTPGGRPWMYLAVPTPWRPVNTPVTQLPPASPLRTAALADPGQCPNPCTVKMERHFLKTGKVEISMCPLPACPPPLRPFQLPSFTSTLGSVQYSRPCGVCGQGPVAAAPGFPPGRASPPHPPPLWWLQVPLPRPPQALCG